MKAKLFVAVLLAFALLLCVFSCSSRNSTKCQKCGAECESTMVYCPDCGEKLTSVLLCSKGHENTPGSLFCSLCGDDLTASTGSDTPDTSADSNAPDTSAGSDAPDTSAGNETPDTSDSTNKDPGNDPSADNSKNIWLMTREYSKGANYSRKYYYNYDGVLVNEEVYYTSDNKTDTIYKYSYDDHGTLLLKSTSYCSYGSSNSWVYENKYDEAGKLITVILNSSWVDTYTYDSNGKLQSIVCVKNGTVTGKEEYVDGKIKRVYIGEDILEQEYFYDANGRLERKEVYVSVCYNGNTQLTILMGKQEGTDQIPSNTTRVEVKSNTTTYVYDGNGNNVYEKLVSYNGNTSETINEYMTLFDYRAQNLHNSPPVPNTGSGSGSGGNSSGGSGSGKGTKCLYCEDTPGKLECSVCDGTGKVFKKYDSNGNKVMQPCIYSKCNNGRIECYHCGGDGVYGN